MVTGAYSDMKNGRYHSSIEEVQWLIPRWFPTIFLDPNRFPFNPRVFLISSQISSFKKGRCCRSKD